MDTTDDSHVAQKVRTVVVEPLALPIPAAVAISGLSRSAIYREAGGGESSC